jgi:hypothetical protein
MEHGRAKWSLKLAEMAHRPAFRAAVGRGAEVIAAGGAKAFPHLLAPPIPPNDPRSSGRRADGCHQPVTDGEAPPRVKSRLAWNKLAGDQESADSTAVGDKPLEGTKIPLALHPGLARQLASAEVRCRRMCRVSEGNAA